MFSCLIYPSCHFDRSVVNSNAKRRNRMRSLDCAAMAASLGMTIFTAKFGV